MNLCILSGCDHVRFNSFVNHRLFAEANGADYIFDLTLTPVGRLPYFNKLRMVRDRLRLFDAVFWIDDDAYFTDFGWEIERYFKAYDSDLVICKSPINQGAWTWISSGQFFIRRSARSFALLEAALSVDIGKVKAWWNSDLFGLRTDGDQDALVHLLATDARFRDGFVTRLAYTEFNSRPFHFRERLDEHRLVHFASTTVSKHDASREFVARMKCNPFLVPERFLTGLDLSRYLQQLPQQRKTE